MLLQHFDYRGDGNIILDEFVEGMASSASIADHTTTSTVSSPTRPKGRPTKNAWEETAAVDGHDMASSTGGGAGAGRGRKRAKKKAVSPKAKKRHGGTLPDGWEERFTEKGRPYYVNHLLQTTQWDPPPSPSP